MLVGKVGQATRLIDNENGAGILPINDDTIQKLKGKHPPAKKRIGPELSPHIKVEPVIFEAIDGPLVQSVTKNANGSGGPTLVDTDSWKYMLCSKNFGKASDNLASAIADTAKRLCSEQINPCHLTHLLESRLVSLDKNPGLRPIGIGEVLRRIIGKCVVQILKSDIMEACGTLQTCSGIDSGIEASIHAMADRFAEKECQGLLLVDASNAFNSVNREKALDTVALFCPVFHQYLKNTYQAPNKLFISGSDSGQFIWGEEGTTQGDVTAMPFYGVSTRPIIEDLVKNTKASSVWYADDSSAAGKLVHISEWWNRLNTIGPSYGYYPNSKKTVLIVKCAEDVPEAERLFGESNVEITVAGERHLGAVVGSEDFKEKYIKDKVLEWITDI